MKTSIIIFAIVIQMSAIILGQEVIGTLNPLIMTFKPNTLINTLSPLPLAKTTTKLKQVAQCMSPARNSIFYCWNITPAQSCTSNLNCSAGQMCCKNNCSWLNGMSTCQGFSFCFFKPIN